MLDSRGYILNWLCSLIPYTIATWVLTKLIGENANFWMLFGIMLLVRLGFTIMETLGGTLAWRLFNKKAMVTKIVNFLHSRSFPPRRYAFDDFETYLFRLDKFGSYPPKLNTFGQFIPDETPIYYPQELISEARHFEEQLIDASALGFLVESRTNLACNLALDIYAPRALAPKDFDGDAVK